jgi:hypothetical protein
MQRDDTSASKANPFLFFCAQILLCAKRFAPDGILNQADLVAQPVTFVHALENCTRKGQTIRAEIKAFCLGAILERAFSTMFRFGINLPLTALARIFFL